MCVWFFLSFPYVVAPFLLVPTQSQETFVSEIAGLGGGGATVEASVFAGVLAAPISEVREQSTFCVRAPAEQLVVHLEFYNYLSV